MSVLQNSLVASMANREQWHTLIESIFGSVNMDLGNPAKFRGNIRRAVFGDIELNEVLTCTEYHCGSGLRRTSIRARVRSARQ